MFYSVVAGSKVGVFLELHECMEAVKYKHGAKYQAFNRLQEAVQHQNRYGFRHNAIRIYRGETSARLDDFWENYDESELPAVDSELGACFPFGHDLCANVQFYPTKKNVVVKLQQENNTLTMTRDQWNVFRAFTEEFEIALDEIKAGENVQCFQHIGGYMFVELRSPLPVFDIRYWYPQEKRRLKRDNAINITFRESEWHHLMNLASQIESFFQDETCGIRESLI